MRDGPDNETGRASDAQTLVGVEHEYRVSQFGRQVDFRRLIHELPLEGRRIDPGDVHAYRMGSGTKITCDGLEAEIATPPVDLSPGFVAELLAWTGMGGRSYAR